MPSVSRTTTILIVIALAACSGGEETPLGYFEDGKADGWGGQVAPARLLSVEGAGTWVDEVDEEAGRLVIRAWVDARVANLRYDKRIFIEVLVQYEGGAMARMLLPASYRGGLSGGDERWGTDAIEIYPEGGPWGAALTGPVLFRLRMQHDLDGDDIDEMVVNDWRVLHGEGEPSLPPVDPWAPGLISPVEADVLPAPPDVIFAPFDDPGRRTVEEIERIIAAERNAPDERHTLHAAVFNILDDEIIDRLIEAHHAGVEVRLIFDGRKHRPWYDWYRGDDRLLEAGVPLLGVLREESGAMHDKIALYDGRLVSTGSANWEWGARFENHENTVFIADSEIYGAYARRFEALAGGPLLPREQAVDSSARVSVSFAPDEEPYRIVGDLIDGASESVWVAMFTAKDVEYDLQGQPTSILRRLVAAHERGVEVVVVVDYGIHEASEYHGVLTEDDPIDEWLEDQGVRVIRADNTQGEYASMHHKFVVIDGEIAVTGAFNWYYDAAYRNDEDQIVWRDVDVADRYAGEFVHLLRSYDPEFDETDWTEVEVDVEVHHDATLWGDRLFLVGDLPELGSWNPSEGVELSSDDWPLWRTTVTLPAGTRARYKLVVRHIDGDVDWESGDDRRLVLGVDDEELEITFR